MAWIIVNTTDESLAWSNEDGWTETTFDTYSEDERETLSLPIDGDWRQVLWEKQL